MINAALVLEGGSFRSLYTAGVLDAFLEKKIEFSCVIGVSAGALTAANYISKQKFRTAQINVLHSSDSNYYGLRQLLTKKSVFNFDYLFDSPINHVYPYDEQELRQTKQKFYVTATDCDTGNAKYFRVDGEYKKMTDYLRASSSLPLLAPFAEVDEGIYLDGGIVSPIGIDKAYEDNFDKVVVVLTRERNYLKKPKSKIIRTLFDLHYRKYPQIVNALDRMPEIYNKIKRKVNYLEEEGKIFVIQPEKMIKIGIVERNARKLIQLYFQGVTDGEKNIETMMEYLNT